jgi:hypothetical protein
MSLDEDQMDALDDDMEKTCISIWFQRQIDMMRERYGS